jgi:carbonic anhydrase
MRNLIALLASSFVIMAASAIETTPSGRAPAAEPVKVNPVKAGAQAVNAGTEPVKTGPEALKQKIIGMPAATSAAAARARDDQAEVDLSARIAARLAVMRANQAARAAQAAKVKKAAAAAALAAQNAVPTPPPVIRSNHWSYEGETGPANWGRINPSWTKCGSGTRQSPIDLRDGMKVDLDQIGFDYKPSSFNVMDNGHTVQVTLGGGNYITVQNRMYELVQFHFHRPSEERINGKGFEMVVHLVHKDVEGKFAVVSLLLERGKQQNTIQTVWNNLPLEKHELMAPAIMLDPGEMLPQRREYFTYMGSLTEPPCSEGVLWMVMKEPVQASPAQMALFSRLYPLNARPIQPTSGRIIKESN